MRSRIQQLEAQNERSEQRINAMSRQLAKLQHFKQSVLASFAEDGGAEAAINKVSAPPLIDG
jgi:hypothetical protein